MLTINAPVFDVEGNLLIESPDGDGLAAFSRRVTRTPTLDGGAAVADFGYSAADRTLTISWTPLSKSDVGVAKRLVQSYSRLIVSFSEGCFVGSPDSYDESDGTISITYLIERQLSA